MLLSFNDLYQKYDMKVSGVLHVGAHHGQEVKEYVSKGIKNMVFFEPLPESVAILEDNLGPYAGDNNIVVFPYAAGNEEKTIEMYVSDHTMCSSLLAPKVVLTQYPGIKFPSKTDVQMIKIDDAEIDFEFNLMNIDVQGYELEVLKGSAETLNNIDYIYTEINRAEVYENAPHVNELDAFLSPYGFKRVETDWSGETWGDGFYIKEKK
jgi:FkbM family methyltransferase